MLKCLHFTYKLRYIWCIMYIVLSLPACTCSEGNFCSRPHCEIEMKNSNKSAFALLCLFYVRKGILCHEFIHNFPSFLLLEHGQMLYKHCPALFVCLRYNHFQHWYCLTAPRGVLLDAFYNWVIVNWFWFHVQTYPCWKWH